MKNKNLQEFIAKSNPAKISRIEVLKKFADEIKELRANGFNFQQIANYINLTYKIKTSRQTVSKIFNEVNNECE
ncbi:MAG: hypothetical protein PHS65_04730 [Arcobacteraceae bacterium]|nr:hypothetical protein [Arcobacteraceae bacterium]